VTVGLFVLTDLSPAAVAGTAIVTHVATGAFGTLAYWRSGQLRRAPTRRAAAVLAAAALVGTPIGVLVNGVVSGPGFGVLLAAVVAATGILVLVRERRVGSADRPPPRTAVVAAIGTTVAVAAGLFGIGGPMLAVPLLLFCGMPVLDALGAAQAQSILIASVGTVGYGAQGAIDWPLAVAVGVPELAGVLIGWRIAHAVPTHRLRLTLAAALICLAPYLALHGAG
jgi:uncharacterized membrane protein YfcA